MTTKPEVTHGRSSGGCPFRDTLPDSDFGCCRVNEFNEVKGRRKTPLWDSSGEPARYIYKDAVLPIEPALQIQERREHDLFLVV